MARRSHRSRTRSSRAPAPVANGWRIAQAEVEEALVTGVHARELEELFGEDEYKELVQLAQAVQSRGRRGGRRVLILPGIMGSKLGVPNKLLFIDDVYWLDPLDVVLGRLARLALPEGAKRIRALGVFLIAYLKLKLRLKGAGYDADFYAFDWRKGIDELGRELARKLAAEPRPVALVAHSMGGVVARAALKSGARIERLVQLGTPNFGSFAPLLALRGVHDAVKKIAALDLGHDKADLIGKVFGTFPGLLQLLPSLPNDPGAVFFDPASWPRASKLPAPAAELLRAASRVQSFLAPVDAQRWTLIAGVNQDTVTAARYVPKVESKDERDPRGDEIEFTITPGGDGTVPLDYARVAGLPTYYVEDSHGSLPNNKSVAAAVADILESGRTSELPAQPPALRRSSRRVTEGELRARDPFAELGVRERAPQGGTRSPLRSRVRSADLREVLHEFVSGRASSAPVTPTAGSAEGAVPLARVQPWNRLVVGRARQHRLEIQLARSSITDVEARAYVLGLFREVTPTGAAGVIDRRLDGAVTEFTRRRMFSGGIGEVFIMPANRRQLRAEMVLFAGLGYFDQFSDDVQQTVAENVIRTFIKTRVEDFATVLVGSASGIDAARSLANLLQGFVRGMLDADHDHHFRRVVLCELDQARYGQIKDELYRLASTTLFESIEVTFSELEPRAELEAVLQAPDGARAATRAARDPAYLLVRRERDDGKKSEYRSSVLTADSKAAVISEAKEIDNQQLDELLESLLDDVERDRFGLDGVRRLGSEIGKRILSERVAGVLPSLKDRHLVVVHDGPSSRIPWESMRLGSWAPALEYGMSRRYMADNLSVAKYLEQRASGRVLEVLLVVDPTEDLAGAVKEGERLERILDRPGQIRVTKLFQGDATRLALIKRLQSGSYDLVHYAGHAFFDAEVPARSGLVCADAPLTGVDLANLGTLPRLVFFNACESGRVRQAGVRKKPDLKAHKLNLKRRLAPAEAFLSGGIANFIGTYWSVGDDSAKAFSARFYELALAGKSLGEAATEARRLVRDESESPDWADYIHYGDYAFTLR